MRSDTSPALRCSRGTVALALLGFASVQGLGCCSASAAENSPAESSAESSERVRVFAAASLTNALTAIGQAWAGAGHPQPSLAFASSGTLATQIEAGAPADLYASADEKWMDQLDMRGLIDRPSRRNLLGTTLVLIAPVAIPGEPGAAKPVTVEMRRGFPIATAFQGKLCTGEPDSVPAGIYARQALVSLGWWDSLQGRIVGTDDVRAALAFVERGECALGIVYATDALVSRKVRVVARFPEDSHDPILYPFALLQGARPAARAFLEELESPSAAALFAQYGFTVLPK
jgi:molybdate transport system substrate-binding protein